MIRHISPIPGCTNTGVSRSDNNRAERIMLTVHLEHDADLECPNDMDCEWRLYSFGRRHNSYVNPETIGLSLEQEDDGTPKVVSRKLRTKLKNGLAHWCSYYEHGNSEWFRKAGNIPCGVEFRWDGVRFAGILIWEHKASEIGGKSYEDRAKDADGFLRRYTSWANGEGWYYRVEDENGKDIGSCGGYDDSDYMLSEMVYLLVGREFEVVGDADYLGNKLRTLVRGKVTV